MKQAAITGWGFFVPVKELTNSDLEKTLETSDEWIIQRTGIRKRHISGPDEFASDLAVKAVDDLKKRYNKSVEDVDFIIVASSTPDFFFPSIASLVQNAHGIKNAGAIDISAACSGWSYGLILANSLISSGTFKKILVIGAEVLSKSIDYSDRNVCILFGDGAAVTLIEASDASGDFIGSHCGSDGSAGNLLYRSALSNHMNGLPVITDGRVHQDGKRVYKWAVSHVQEGVQQLLKKYNYTLDQIQWFVPHSANLRMIEAISEGLNISMNKTLTSIEEYGNTSSVSIPFALYEGVRAGKLKKGDIVLLYGFGGGMVHAGCIFRWNL
jgi:3-oxoacyl-[acyl-carrier-protein] synthase-3